MPTLKKFLSSVEPKPSPVHGRGIFTKKAIKQGDYCSQGAQDIVAYVKGMTAANSPLAPTWKELLFGDDAGGEGVPLGERLEKFRSDFANFVEEENSRANVIESFAFSDGRPREMRATVRADLKRGREVLRPYGPEWLSIKYYHLKANLIIYRKKLGGDGRTFMVYIDPADLFLQDITIWKDNEMGMGPEEGAKLLSERAGKEVRHVTLEELGLMANLLGMLAHEYFGKGNWKFDSSWRTTQTQLKQQQQQQQQQKQPE